MYSWGKTDATLARMGRNVNICIEYVDDNDLHDKTAVIKTSISTFVQHVGESNYQILNIHVAVCFISRYNIMLPVELGTRAIRCLLFVIRDDADVDVNFILLSLNRPGNKLICRLNKKIKKAEQFKEWNLGIW